MECKWHPGQEADLTCVKCGEHYCRECVKETREPSLCPDCHRAEVERFASQMRPREPRAKKQKPEKDRAAELQARKEKKEKKKEKRPKPLKKPAEKPLPPSRIEAEPVEKPIEPEPPATEAEDEFWGDMEKPRRASRRASKKAPPPIELEGLPPLPEEFGEPGAGEGSPAGPELVPDSAKRPVPKEDEREEAVFVSEGFPSRPRVKEEEEKPARAGRHAAAKEKKRKPGGGIIRMQLPEDYAGETTASPSYLKAVLWGCLAGLVGAGIYAALAWWLHWDRGIFGWIIGFAVGVAVVLGSGRHFSWKLGLIAAGIALVSVSVGRIAYFMLDVRFNNVFPFKLGFFTLLKESVINYGNEFFTLWLVFFLTAGIVAFLLAFWPWPIRFQAPGAGRTGRAVRRSA